MTPESWYGRVLSLSFGWYLTQSYSRYPQPEFNLLSMGIVTFGVVIVGVTCYDWGRAERKTRCTNGPNQPPGR